MGVGADDHRHRHAAAAILAPHVFWVGFEVVGMAVVSGLTILLVLRFGTRLREDLSELQRIAAENARLFANAEQAVRARDEFLSVQGTSCARQWRRSTSRCRTLRLALQPALASDGPHSRPALARVDCSLGAADGQLIDEVLDVSRIQAGRLELSPEPTDLGRRVHEVVARFAGRAPRRLELGVRPPARSWAAGIARASIRWCRTCCRTRSSTAPARRCTYASRIWAAWRASRCATRALA